MKESIAKVLDSDTRSIAMRQGDTTLSLFCCKKSKSMRHHGHQQKPAMDYPKWKRRLMEKLNVIRQASKKAESKRKTSYVKGRIKSSDIISTMEAIMKHNTKYYQSDFEIDKKILKEAAENPVETDKALLWLSRTHGTHCFKERDVFLKNSCAYHTWLYYADQTHEHVLAYAVEITGVFDGKLTGSLYHLDYEMHCRHLIETAIPVDHVKVIYEHGSRIVPAGQHISVHTDRQMGKVVHLEEYPKDLDIFERILQEERDKRHLSKPVQYSSAYASTGEKAGYLKSAEVPCISGHLRQVQKL